MFFLRKAQVFNALVFSTLVSKDQLHKLKVHRKAAL